MDYGKGKAAPGENGDGRKIGRYATKEEATRTALFVQANSIFTPPGLTLNQAEAHRRDMITRLRLGLPMRPRAAPRRLRVRQMRRARASGMRSH